MATVKVKLRPSSVEGKASVIFYQITHNRKTQQITTKLRVQPTDWDSDKELLAPAAPNRSMIQNRVDSDIALLKRIIFDLDSSGMDYSVTDVVSRYKSPQSHISVLDYMRTQIEQLRAANRHGTAQNYDKTMHSFKAFLGAVELSLSAITEQMIADYNADLVQRGLVRNSVSFYMRVLRAVYNKSVRQKLIEQTNPFADVYTGMTVHASVLCRSRSLHNFTVLIFRKALRLHLPGICSSSVTVRVEWPSWISPICVKTTCRTG